MTTASPRRRTLGVWVVLLGLLALAAELITIAALATSETARRKLEVLVVGQLEDLNRLPFLPHWAVALLTGMCALGLLLIGIGFWRWQRWAWVSVMALAAVVLSVNAVAAIVGTADHVAMVIAIILVFYINQNDVQLRFGAQPQRANVPLVWADSPGRGD